MLFIDFSLCLRMLIGTLFFRIARFIDRPMSPSGCPHRPYRPDFWMNPYPVFRRLRDEAPLYYDSHAIFTPSAVSLPGELAKNSTLSHHPRVSLQGRTSMAKITYVEHLGKEHVIDVTPGSSVMQGAIGNNVRGVIAECGGACSCATCHVYVDDAWVDKLPKKSDEEEAMLDAVCEPNPSSRLSCQIKVTESLDGLIVRMPKKQV